MKDRKEIKWKAILIILSIFAAVKMLFFAFGLDEEYQLVMAYRYVKGDRLFLDMWEPHQSSAFLCALLMRPYLAIVGETGLVIWLRFCGSLFHLGVSFYLGRTLRRMISRDSAFLVGLIYFNTIPKQIMLPEFGIMQVWFLTLLSLFLIRYYDSDVRKRRYLILSAFALVLTVLAYPSCVLLYFFVLGIIRRRSGRERFADMGIFTGICGLCGAAYLESLLRNNTPKGLLRTLFFIVNGDITHSLSFADKLLSLGKDLLIPVFFCAAVFLLAKAGAARVVAKRKAEGEETTKDAFFRWQTVLAAALSCLAEICYWVVFNAGYESMQIHLAVFTVMGIWHVAHDRAGYRAGKRAGKGGEDAEQEAAGGIERKQESGLKEQEAADGSGREPESRRRLQRGLLLDGIVLAGGALLAVLYLTDLGLMDSLPHAMTAAFFGITLVIMYWEGKAPERTERNRVEGEGPGRKRSAACVDIILLLWAFTAVFGKGYSLRSGTGYHNVLQSGGILKYGPAAGTISDYMCAYIYNCDYEDWQNMVRDGDRVLIMVDQVMNLGTIQYLFKDVEISHYSIVNPTAYDGRLLDYWEMFPEKAPNVIIVDDWYGQLMTDPDSWLMRYAEGEFGYTSVEQGRYIRIYRKDQV